MPNTVFPQQKPSMSLEQAIHQTIAHCQAGQWQQAEVLYRALTLSQSSSTQGQYWLSYIDALIQAGKPHAVPAAVAALTAPQQEQQEARQAPQIPFSIKLAKASNPCYTARQPRWPWKMALGYGHVPGRKQIYLLLAHYQGARYEQAETLARSLTHAFPLHDLGWKVLVATLRMQGRMAEAQQAQQQRRICHDGRRKNVLPKARPTPME
jgi:hypothetical protein